MKYGPQTHRERPQAVLSSDGYTLLELLLALGMTVVLLGVLFTSLDLYWRFSLSGQEEISRSQIARAVFNRISHDMRSTIYRPKPKTSSANDSTTTSDDAATGSNTGTSSSGNQSASNTSTNSTSGSTGSGTTQNQSTNSSASSNSGTSSMSTVPTEPMLLTDAYSGPALGIFGDESSIVMHVAKPDRLQRGAADVAGSPYSSSDLKAVAYYLGDGSGSLATMFGLMTGGSPGLTRMSADRLSLSLAGTTTDLVTAASKPELLAPEIDTMSFSYFDGAEWLSSWDSEVEGRLPNAIGVSLKFRAPQGSETSFISRSASAMTDSFRIVITLPTANSFEGFSL